MRRLRRLFVLLFVVFVVFVVFFRGPSSEYTVPQTKAVLNTRQPFAFSALLHLSNSYIDAAKHAQNVLFISESTSTASRLIQLANDLALQFERTSGDQYDTPGVHFLFLGPYSVNLDFFMKANGVNASLLYVHDGRARLNRAIGPLDPSQPISVFDIAPGAVRAALETTYRFLRPENTIWSPMGESNEQFRTQIRAYLGGQDSKWSPLELPADQDDLRWMAYLGLDGLKAWGGHEFDIVIPVISHSGSLIRLLDSIAHAKYYLPQPPRVTVYLPSGPADPSLVNYIERSLNYPRDRIILQSVFAQRSTAREAAFATAIKAYVPSSKRANVIILADTVRLSPFWFHWTMFTLLRFSPEGLDTEQTTDLPALAGISLCALDENLSPFLLTQSKAKLSCSMFFPPHFRVLQSFHHEKSLNTISTGVRRTLPVPEEMSFLKSRSTAAYYDMHDLLLPMYFRGYVLLSQTGELVPAIDDSLFTKKQERLLGDQHKLIEMPIYEWISVSQIESSLPAPESDKSIWQSLPVFPDLESSSNCTVDRLVERGTEFAKVVSPQCNVVEETELSKRVEDLLKRPKSETPTIFGIRTQEDRSPRRPILSKVHDNWSDVFCIEFAEEDPVKTPVKEKTERAKSLEEEKKEHKAKAVINAADATVNRRHDDVTTK